MEPFSDKKQLIYGRHPVIEALKSGQAFEKIFIQKGGRGPEIQEITREAATRGIPYQYVPPEKLNRLTGKNHQGIIAFLSFIAYYNLEDVLLQVYDKGETPLFLLLDGVTDVRNFGAIARSAEAAGVHALVIPSKGTAMLNAEAMKASAGALNKIPVCRHKTIGEALQYLKLNGIAILAAEQKGSKRLQDLNLKIPLAIVLGSEGEGIQAANIKIANERFHIPMFGEIDSYNVSVSAGIVLYEAIRQRGSEQ